MTVWEYVSPIGAMTLAEENGALVGAWFEHQKYYPEALTAEYGETEIICQAESWLDAYFAGKCPDIGLLPLAPKGSDFRRQVWQLLCAIPYGETTTYAALAAQLAKARNIPRMSAQAVGGAVGHNPISIIIPCHRVVGADGSLTGYAGGVGNKLRLLRLEGADVSRLRVPTRGTAL